MWISLKRFLPYRIKKRIKLFKDAVFYRKKTSTLERTYKGNRKRVILIGTPEHGNLGDHAIAFATGKFFADFFPRLEFIEVTTRHYIFDKKRIARCITDDDMLVLNGGGSIGTLWMDWALVVFDIIQTFPRNNILIFPQTVFFEEGDRGKSEIDRTRMIYGGHHNLTLFVRDVNSCDLVAEHGIMRNKGDCVLMPDMVTYLCESDNGFKRSGILLCMRTDKESVLSGESFEVIKKTAAGAGMEVCSTTTVIPETIALNERDQMLKNKLDEFRRSRLVITDRLHGMLFAVVTGTPCIALDNISGKVKGAYQWLRSLEYLRFVDNPKDVALHVEDLLELQGCHYDAGVLRPYFEKLADLVQQRLEI